MRKKRKQTKAEIEQRQQHKALVAEVRSLRTQVKHVEREAFAHGRSLGTRTVLAKLYLHATVGEQIFVGQLLMGARQKLDPLEAELRERVLVRNSAMLIGMGFKQAHLDMPCDAMDHDE